ncbi:MAG TPA: prepilin peptidase [Candidatus Paceibacterota bacterium]|nr:prepilin peptidase [Candidatus Paceibacterota bacterium]
MNLLLLFILGSLVGSFLGVISDRYREDLPIWDRKVIGGIKGESSRSRCEFCKKKLSWFELIPFFSFIFQGGRCRSCRHWIGWRYLFFEGITGLIFVAVPLGINYFYLPPVTYYLLSALWISVFSVLFLVSLIDIRLRIIPDEANLFLALLGILIAWIQPFGELSGSFIEHYAMLFGLRSNVWVNHFAASAAAGLFFIALIAITRGKGMGGGDMKLAIALGMVFGWPDIIFVAVVSFVIGSVFGIGAMALKKEKLKSKVAFGPFLAASALIIFLFGYQITNFYFGLFGM